MRWRIHVGSSDVHGRSVLTLPLPLLMVPLGVAY